MADDSVMKVLGVACEDDNLVDDDDLELIKLSAFVKMIFDLWWWMLKADIIEDDDLKERISEGQQSNPWVFIVK